MMILASASLAEIGVLDAGIVALLGYVVVFFGLALLMCVVLAMGRVFIALDRRAKAKADAMLNAMPAAAPVDESPKPAAPGSAGGVKLHDVEPKTAAMLMAIVADRLGKPLNELRFISIKEVK